MFSVVCVSLSVQYAGVPVQALPRTPPPDMLKLVQHGLRSAGTPRHPRDLVKGGPRISLQMPTQVATGQHPVLTTRLEMIVLIAVLSLY